MSRILEALKQMPVYPDGIKFGKSKNTSTSARMFRSANQTMDSSRGFPKRRRMSILRLAESCQPHTNRRAR